MALVQAADGNFYGATEYGGTESFFGTIFRMTPGGSVTILHSIGANEGYFPDTLIMGLDGSLYGTDQNAIFRVTLDGTFTVLSFLPGEVFGTSLVQALDGSLYGVMRDANNTSHGAVYRVTMQGALTIIHTFTGGLDGNLPASGLARAADGSLYGTTSGGGG